MFRKHGALSSKQRSVLLCSLAGGVLVAGSWSQCLPWQWAQAAAEGPALPSPVQFFVDQPDGLCRNQCRPQIPPTPHWQERS